MMVPLAVPQGQTLASYAGNNAKKKECAIARTATAS